MAATTINKIALPHTNACYNITDSADFAVMGVGAGNGVVFTWASNDIIVLKNTTGGNATYTFHLAPVSAITNYGGAVVNPTNVVAAGKIEIARLDSQFKDSSNQVTIECDVAGSILVLTP